MIDMITLKRLKTQIDAMDYAELLRHWRQAPAGDPMFKDEIGDYYAKIMKEKKAALEVGEAIAISKEIGWEREA